MFVSTMSEIYSIEEDQDEEHEKLRDQMKDATWPDGRPVYTPAVCVGLMVFFVWMILSVPGGINRGYSFDLVFGNFIKTVLMYFVIAGAVRGGRDVERLAAVYLLGAALYAGVVLLRFDVGSGDD